MKDAILAIDQGTTSTRAVLFDSNGKLLHIEQREISTYFPSNGWVEQDPEEIWNKTQKVFSLTLKKATYMKTHIRGMGITNQRETIIAWDKITGKPLYNAIVWQDRRTAKRCEEMEKDGLSDEISNKTGLIIDPYFSATKISWILDNVEDAKRLALSNRLAVGTIDTFLLFKFTNGDSFYTDITNASRTNLYNIYSNKWDDTLLEIYNIPINILPKVKDNIYEFGSTEKKLCGYSIPILSMVGDQQSSSLGQFCFNAGEVKATFGTGCFILMNTGTNILRSKNKLLTTICYRLNGKITYALEGSIFIAGAGIQWLRDKINLINKASDTEKIVKSLKSNNGIYLVPAFTGLGAPYWNPNSRGIICGLTRDTSKKEIVRATLESVAYQSYDLFNAMKNDGLRPNLVKVDGGMVKNNWFSQFLSDIIDLDVIRPRVYETTALGAALMAGLKIGVYKSLKDVSKNWKIDKKFYPKMNKVNRSKLLKGWKQAITKTLI